MNSNTGAVLRHLELFYSDAHIINDMDCVPESEAVSAYVMARRTAIGFKPGSFQSNNHNRIPVAVVETLTSDNPKTTRCRCGCLFQAVRVNSVHCRRR
jgi:hypothetical protein